MKLKFSFHSLKRIKEREIDKDIVINAIRLPDKVEISKTYKDRFLI